MIYNSVDICNSLTRNSSSWQVHSNLVYSPLTSTFCGPADLKNSVGMYELDRATRYTYNFGPLLAIRHYPFPWDKCSCIHLYSSIHIGQWILVLEVEKCIGGER